MTDYATWTDEQCDIAIVERLCGWSDQSEPGPGQECFTDRPTQSATAMLGVINAMGKRGWWCRIQSPWSPGEANPVWSAGFTPAALSPWTSYQAATPMRAVAIAALMALDAEGK